MNNKEELEKQEIAEEPEQEKSGLLANPYFKLGILIFWSFIIVFAGMYFFLMKNQDAFVEQNVENASNPSAADTSLTALADSSAAASDSTVSLDSSELDSMPTFAVDSSTIKVADGFLSLKDQIKLLAIENGRRQREIDHLWGEFLKLNRKMGNLIETLANQQQEDSTNAGNGLAGEQGIAGNDTALSDEEIARKRKEAKKAEEALMTIAKIYGSMKPDQAAKLLDDFDEQMAAKILTKMRERQAAKILELMKPDQAVKICKIMASPTVDQKRG